MVDDKKYQTKFQDFLSQWIEIQKKNILTLTILQEDDRIGRKVYLRQLERPNSYSEAQTTYEKFKLLKGYNLKLIDEKMNDEEYIQLHTIISTISKIQGISLINSFAYLIQVYLIVIDYSRSLSNDTIFTLELREFMNKGVWRNKNPLFNLANIVKLWQEFGYIFLEGIFYHTDKFRIHPKYTYIPPLWLTGSENKALKMNDRVNNKKPLFIDSEFYTEIKQKIPQIEEKLRDAYNNITSIQVDSELDMAIRNNSTYMNVEECAEYLRMSTASLYQLTSKSKIPHSKPGKMIIFRKNDIDKWLDSPKRKVFTNEELEEKLSIKHKPKNKRIAKRIDK